MRSSPMTTPQTARPIQWLSWGDLNAFFGLFLDNLLNLVVVTGLLVTVFEFPAEFALTHMIRARRSACSSAT